MVNCMDLIKLVKKIKELTDEEDSYFKFEEEETKLMDDYEKGNIKALFYSFDTAYGVFLQPSISELSRDLPDVDEEDYLTGGLLIPTEKWKLKDQPKVGIFVDDSHRYCCDAHPTCNQFSEKKYIHKFYFYALYEKLKDTDFDDWYDEHNELFFDFIIEEKHLDAIKALMDQAGVSEAKKSQILDSFKISE